MKILLADDHALFREGMEMIIERILPNAKITSVDDWQQVHMHTKHVQFDIALLDLFMPRMIAWEQELTQLINNHPKIAICIITASSVHSHIQQALNIGAKGFIHKTLGVKEIQTALLNLQQGLYYTPTLYQKNSYNNKGISKLTSRQKEVLALLIKGQSNKIIASNLNITETTVKRHVYNIYQMLGVKNRVEVGKIVDDQGLLFN